MSANLVLHVGARRVPREELNSIPCPEAEGRWRPVPHGTVLDFAEKALLDAGYGIQDMALGLSKDNARFFGTLTLQAPIAGVAALAVGIRSSLDKSIALGWCCGSRVFCCDNLAFSASVVIARKHTTNGVVRYQEAISKAVAGLQSYRDYERTRIEEMCRRQVNDEQASHVLLKAFEAGILSPRTIGQAWSEWVRPSHADFEARNAFSLYNAITAALSGRAQSNPQAHAHATIRLGSLILPQAAAPQAA